MHQHVAKLAAFAYRGKITMGEVVQEVKRAYIIEALTDTGFNICKTAREMGLHRNTLSRMCDDVDINVNKLRDEARGRKPSASVTATVQPTTRMA